MSILNKIFSKNINESDIDPLRIDMHSHLIPDVDDGVKTVEESIKNIRALMDMGYEKIITTPHIMTDFFKNSKDTLFPKLELVQEELLKQNIHIPFSCAAEYYLDDGFPAKIKDKDNLLMVKDNLLLVETSYINEPVNFTEIIFDMLSNDIKPIIAHPERYTYMYHDFEKYIELYEKGVLFQLNINSLSGYYSKAAKNISEKLIDNNMVDFLGTDCHGTKHIDALEKSRKSKYYKKALSLDIKNNTLL